MIENPPFLSQVLVKVHAIGINPVETYIRAGAFPGPTAKPHILGSDAAGEIESVGEDVKKFKVWILWLLRRFCLPYIVH